MNVKSLETNCNSILFHELCDKFERIEKTSTSVAKLKIIFSKDLKILLSGQSVFPLMRLLLPINDSERGKYGIKQASIAKAYIEALQLSKTSVDAQRLLKWKDPSKAFGVESSKIISGDFCTILEDVLKTRVLESPSNYNLGQVNELLDEISSASGEKSKTNILCHKILNVFNAKEQVIFILLLILDLYRLNFTKLSIGRNG